MEQNSTKSNTPPAQQDKQFPNLFNNKMIPQFSQFTTQDLLHSKNPLISQLMACNNSIQNFSSHQNINSNSRTANQFNSSTSLGCNNTGGSATSIPNPNSSNQILSLGHQMNNGSITSSLNQTNETQSPIKSNQTESIINQIPPKSQASNCSSSFNFLNSTNTNNLLQFQQQLQQLQNQQLNFCQNTVGVDNQSNILGIPFKQTTLQNVNQQQQLLFNLNMMENANLNNIIQQQQQHQQMDQMNGQNINNIQLMMSQLQQFPNVMNMKLPNCQKHQFKPESSLKFICSSQSCNQQLQLLCQNCLVEHTPNHEIMDARLFISQVKGKMQENITTTNQQFNTIETLFNVNIQGLEGMSEYINNLLESLKSLQRAYFMMKLTSSNDTSFLLNAIKEFEESNPSQNEKQLNEKIASISKLSQNMRQVKMESFQQLINTNQFAGKVILDTKNHITNVQSLVTNLQESFSQKMVGSEMKDLEKKHQEEKTLDHFSKLFHLIKGHAKKRDVINFLTWEQSTKELKYSKDIKDKHGEHFYVSFSLKLKNIENMENKDIDENFINKIVKVVEEKAPEIQNKKNSERKKIDPNGKKRKYCRFNPRIEIDVSLNSSAYKNIKIE